MICKFAKGMVYWVNLPYFNDSVQSGKRPCIIVSNDVGNLFSKNVTIVPCTTNLDKDNSQPTHLKVSVIPDQESIVLCENITTVAKRNCDGFLGILDKSTMAEIDECIKIALALTDSKKAKLQAAPVAPMKPLEIEEPTEEEVTVPSEVKSRLNDPKVQKQFIEDFEKHGVKYIVKKYNVASEAAAYQRKNYYKKHLDK